MLKMRYVVINIVSLTGSRVTQEKNPPTLGWLRSEGLLYTWAAPSHGRKGGREE